MTFDRIAPFYRVMEAIAAGGKMQRCRVAFLNEIPSPRKILIAGEGHGRFLTKCAGRFPDAAIVVVDSSAAMLEIAGRQLAKDAGLRSRVEFVHADLLHWESPERGFDLIVTHFFLDCFTADSLATVVARLADLASPDAHWLLADFQVAGSPLARLRCRAIVAMLYAFFRIICGLQAKSLACPNRDLEQAGFSCHRRVTSEWALLKSEWWRRPPGAPTSRRHCE